jgi:histone H3/H4
MCDTEAYDFSDFKGLDVSESSGEEEEEFEETTIPITTHELEIPQDTNSVSKTDRIKRAKKVRRARPGVAALREIRTQQKKTNHIIPKRPFYRLVREVLQDAIPAGHDIRFKKEAIVAIQEAAEAYIIDVMGTSQTIACFNGRQTLQKKDLKLTVSLYDQISDGLRS